MYWIQSGLIVFAKLCNNVKQSSAPSYSNLTFSKFQGWEDFVEFMEISLLNWFLIPRSLNFPQIGNIIHCGLNSVFVPSSSKIFNRHLRCPELCQRASLDLRHKEKMEDRDFGRSRGCRREGRCIIGPGVSQIGNHTQFQTVKGEV